MNRTQTDVVSHYLRADEERRRTARYRMRTDAGVFLPSPLISVAGLIDRLDPAPHERFIDLGCGDGRVANLAATRCRATGIELDARLSGEARGSAAALGLETTILQEDFMRCDLSGYDHVYLFPDGTEPELDGKLHDELTGTLIVCTDLWWPQTLSRTGTISVRGTDFHLYRRP